MAYIRVWLHCVWGTKKRYPYLTDAIRSTVIDHIKANAKEKSIFIDCINGHLDHLHCLISMTTTQSIAEIMQNMKGESSFWINKQGITKQKFQWADEYYVVSVSESQVAKVREYIRHQQDHHRKQTWSEECETFLKVYGFSQMGG